jgi:hypothetical protein
VQALTVIGSQVWYLEDYGQAFVWRVSLNQ